VAIPKRYPGAIWKPGRDGGTFERDDPDIAKGVLHTTETAGLPQYSSPPHNTVTWANETPVWYQHVEYGRAARALRNAPGGEQTNREDMTFQLEIVCYSDKRIADQSSSRIWVGELPEPFLDSIAEWMTWMEANFGIKHIWPNKQALSYAQANASGFRMTAPEWDKYNGWCGHQHVGEGNLHWDPGALNWDFLMGPDDYREVRNVPEWGEPIVDHNIDRGIIVTTDKFVDNWDRDEMTDGRFWTFLDRALRPIEARLDKLEE